VTDLLAIDHSIALPAMVAVQPVEVTVRSLGIVRAIFPLFVLLGKS